MAGFTNRFKSNILGGFFDASYTIPTNYYLALVTTTPTADTNVFSDLTEIAAGNGYTSGGAALSRNTTDFPTLTEDDVSDLGSIAIKDVVWTASGGPIPASGSVETYAVLLDDNATVANREVLGYFALTGASSVSDGQTFTASGGVLSVNEA